MKDKIEDYEYKHKIEDSELVEIGANLAHVSQDEFDFFEERRSVYAGFKERADSFKERRKRLTEEYNSGYRKEVIKVRAEPHPETGEAWLYKAGTNIRMGSRPITEDERQASFKFEGINDPEESAKNAKAFLKKKKQDEGGEDAAGEEWHETAARLDSHKDDPEPIGEIETDGQEFPKKEVNETKIKFDDDLDFGAAIKIAKDDDDCFHFGYRIASSRMPKYAYPTPVLVNGNSYADYNEMLQMAVEAMIERLNTDPKFQVMTIERRTKITEILEAFAAPEVAVVAH